MLVQDAVAYALRRIVERHEGVRLVQAPPVGGPVIEVDGERHPVRVDGERLERTYGYSKQQFFDQLFDAVENLVARVRADRAAAEDRARRSPQWSPYP